MFALLYDSPLSRRDTLKPGDDHLIAHRGRGAFDLARRRMFLCADRVVCREFVDVRIAPSGRFDGPFALLGGRGLAPSGLMRSFVRRPFSGRSSPACVDQARGLVRSGGARACRGPLLRGPCLRPVANRGTGQGFSFGQSGAINDSHGGVMIRGSGFSNNWAIATGLGGFAASGAVATVGSNPGATDTTIGTSSVIRNQAIAFAGGVSDERRWCGRGTVVMSSRAGIRRCEPQQFHRQPSDRGHAELELHRKRSSRDSRRRRHRA